MRDYYKLYNINISASIEEIRQVMDGKPKSDEVYHATRIFSNTLAANRYKNYVVILRHIGELRSALAIVEGQDWVNRYAQDFSIATPKNPINKPAKPTSSGRHNAKKSIFSNDKPIYWFALGFIILIVYLIQPDATNNSDLATSSVPEQQEVVPTVALPFNGTVTWYSYDTDRALAPFEIRASSGQHFYVKLENAVSGANVMGIFVRSGQTVEVDVPLGTYIVKYASGENWYGANTLFGRQTAYSRAEEIFRFRYDFTQSRYMGYTISLYAVTGGNLSTSRIAPSDF